MEVSTYLQPDSWIFPEGLKQVTGLENKIWPGNQHYPKFGTRRISWGALTPHYVFSLLFNLFFFPHFLSFSLLTFLFSFLLLVLYVYRYYPKILLHALLFILWVKDVQTAVQKNLLILFEKEFFTHYLCLLVSICERKSKCHQKHFNFVFLEPWLPLTFASSLLTSLQRSFLIPCHSPNSKCYY